MSSLGYEQAIPARYCKNLPHQDPHTDRDPRAETRGSINALILLTSLPMASHAQEEGPDDLVHLGLPATTTLSPYKSAFLQACLDASVLTFGTTSKTKRTRPTTDLTKETQARSY